VASEALEAVANYERRLKSLINKFCALTHELEETPPIPVEVCEAVAREVGVAASKATLDALRKVNNAQ
jgi:hypothetical protein